MGKLRGNYFEDFELGMCFKHPTPRTVHGGDLSLYMAVTGDRRPLPSSTELCQSLGLSREVVPDLLVFHLIFGKSVRDISLNARANLGYADVRFLAPVYPGDTLRAESEVIGLRTTSKGDAGIVYVTTRGFNHGGNEVLRFHRWVLVPVSPGGAVGSIREVPELPAAVAGDDLPVPSELNLSHWKSLSWTAGGESWWEDYTPGQTIIHPRGMTVDESDHAMATRLYQNDAAVHFNAHRMARSAPGRRLVYGGHVISVAHALAFDGLENCLTMAAWNGGVHANPTFAGDTLYAVTRVVETHPIRDDLGALRLELFAIKDADPGEEEVPLDPIPGEGRPTRDPRVVLALDYWALCARRPGG